MFGVVQSIALIAKCYGKLFFHSRKRI